MPTFGRYETVRELRKSVTSTVYVARLRGEPAGPNAERFAVKFVQADAMSMDTPEEQLAPFLRQIAVMQSAGAGWAPIHESGQEGDGAYYVTDLYVTSDNNPQNLETLFERRKLRVDDARLGKVVLNIVHTLIKLRASKNRSHGNIKPTNILLAEPPGDSDAQIGAVFIADPAADEHESNAKADLWALASLIHLMIFKTPVRRASVVSLRDVSAWSEAGVKGEFWRKLCEDLLGQGDVPIDLQACRVRVESVVGKLEEAKVKPAAVAPPPPPPPPPKPKAEPKPVVPPKEEPLPNPTARFAQAAPFEAPKAKPKPAQPPTPATEKQEKKSGKGLLIGAAALLLVGGGVAAFVLMSKGGKSGGGGDQTNTVDPNKGAGTNSGTNSGTSSANSNGGKPSDTVPVKPDPEAERVELARKEEARKEAERKAAELKEAEIKEAERIAAEQKKMRDQVEADRIAREAAAKAGELEAGRVLIGQLKNMPENATLASAAALIKAEAAKLSDTSADDARLAKVLQTVRESVEQQQEGIISAVESAKEEFPSGAWPSEAWHNAAKRHADNMVKPLVAAALEKARAAGMTSAPAKLEAVGPSIKQWAKDARIVLDRDAALRSAIENADRIAPGSTGLTPDAASESQAITSAFEALKPAELGLPSGSLTHAAAISKANALIAEKDRTKLLAALTKPSTLADAVIAAELLTPAGWPSTLAEFSAGKQAVLGAESMIGKLPQAKQASVRARLSQPLGKAYMKLLAESAGKPEGPAVMAALDEKLTPESAMPAWAKFNFSRWRAEQSLTGDMKDDQARAVLNSLAAYASDQSIGKQSALATGIASVKKLADEKGESFDSAREGPARKGWTRVSEDAGRVVYRSPDGKVSITFVAVGTGSQRTFVGTSEVSIEVANAAISGANAWADIAGDIGDQFTKPWTDNVWGDAGVSSWKVGINKQFAPAAKRGDRDRSLGWVSYGEQAVKDGIAVFPAGLEPPESTFKMPLQNLSPKAALRIATAAGCRLPTPEEWNLALAAEGGLDAVKAEAKLRDEWFKAWADSSKALGKPPWNNVFRPVVTTINTNVQQASKNAAVFREVDAGGGRSFQNLVGNVAEFVFNDPATCNPDAGGADAALRQNMKVIGGSALSDPLVKLNEAYPVASIKPSRNYADVGFRLAFSAQGTEPLLARAKDAVSKLPWAQPN